MPIYMNGKEISSSNNYKNISISGNRIVIDGKDVTDQVGNEKEIKVHVVGNIEKINCHNLTVDGDAGKINAHNVKIDGDVTGNVNCHNLNCGNISGNAEAKTIKCQNVKTLNL